MSRKKKNSLRFILFHLYEIDPDSSPAIPEFVYRGRDNSDQTIAVLDPENAAGGSLKHALSQLQPLAHSLFVDPETDVTFFAKIHDNLLRELKKTWKSKAPDWSARHIKHLLFEEQQEQDSSKKQYTFRFSFRAGGGIRLERSTFMFYLVITPRLPNGYNSPTPDEIATLARLMVNSLYYRRGLSRNSGRAAKIERVFPGHAQAGNEEGISGLEHLEKRFGGNSLPLIAGILGEAITIEDIFDSLAGPDMQPIDGDRFFSQSLLITPEDKDAPEFSETECLNLEKLARGQNDRYLLPDLRNQTEFVVPIRTFRNVLFIAAGEGLACHVKPGRDQQFLADEFSSRYETIYMLLFVLVVYQRYRLACLANEINDLLRTQDQPVLKGPDKDTVEGLRRSRMRTARHALRIMNTQPTFLTNYREVYKGLQQAFGIRELAEKVQRSSAELDYLLSDQYRREREKENKKFDMAKVILAMTAELFALPYYLYTLLTHLGEHINWVALIITVVVTSTVIFFTWVNFPEKQRKDCWQYCLDLLRKFRHAMKKN